ncbi:MAG: EVE domain-containing protein [Burkholderiales bacterium]|nr:EVE domain-containing protein [Burkholderiales bacterium]
MPATRFWLMKSEPDEFSIDDLVAARPQTTAWFGVRNYQARNFMREMQVGDRALFYHSSCPAPGIAGVVRVSRLAYPDATQFDPASDYYDAQATRESPRWWNVDVELVRKTRFVPIAQMRADPALANMVTLRRGNRLSITPVTAAEWKAVERLTAQPLRP